jgi:hypothetical protein
MQLNDSEYGIHEKCRRSTNSGKGSVLKRCDGQQRTGMIETEGNEIENCVRKAGDALEIVQGITIIQRPRLCEVDGVFSRNATPKKLNIYSGLRICNCPNYSKDYCGHHVANRKLKFIPNSHLLQKCPLSAMGFI